MNVLSTRIAGPRVLAALAAVGVVAAGVGVVAAGPAQAAERHQHVSQRAAWHGHENGVLEAPVEAVPVQQGPVEAVPAQQAPAQEGPVQQGDAQAQAPSQDPAQGAQPVYVFTGSNPSPAFVSTNSTTNRSLESNDNGNLDRSVNLGQ